MFVALGDSDNHSSWGGGGAGRLHDSLGNCYWLYLGKDQDYHKCFLGCRRGQHGATVFVEQSFNVHMHVCTFLPIIQLPWLAGAISLGFCSLNPAGVPGEELVLSPLSLLL